MRPATRGSVRFAFHADWTDVRAVCSGSSLDCLDMGLCVYKLCSIGSCLASALFVRSFVLNCSMTGDELRSLFALTGVEDSLKEYVITAGVQSVLVFSRIGITEQEIRDRVVKHWVETLPSPVEPLRVIVAEAAILAAWDLANTQRLKTIQADTVPAPVLSAPSLPSSSTALAIPTSLRPGVWAEQILKFETQWNPPLEFPVKVLLGSEAILARLLHEATVSRLFTPVSLGEILRNRAYSSSGLVNPLALKRADDQVLLWKKRGDPAELVPTQPIFDPKSTWLVIDALDAVKWAYASSGYATDVVAARLTDPFVRFVRQRTQDLSGIKSLYAAASWELCLLMRAGETFDTAVNDVMTRTHWLREYLDDFKLESRKWWGTSRLSQLSQVALARGIEWRFVARPSRWAAPLVTEEVDPFRHVHLAKQALHPALFHSALDDTAVFAMEFSGLLGSDIVRWRRLIIEEIFELKDELEEATIEWLESLLPHGKIAYKAGACPNVPLLLHIGVLFHYTNVRNLMDDVTAGFRMFGQLAQGGCWADTGCWVPPQPLSRAEFLSRNLEYVQDSFRTRRPDTHSHTLLQGVLKERDEGKISGPFAAPPHWNVRTVPLPPHLRSSVDVSQPLLPWDRPQAAAAVAFAIVTEGSQGEVKVRRGEDWRRSLHNATTQTRGGPRHHTVDDMIWGRTSSS